jgi:carboxyl-terminal processing protease
MNNPWRPLIYTSLVALGVAAGIILRPAGQRSFTNTPDTKLAEILNLVDAMYVDTINFEQAEDDAINQFLHTLDPHSAYIAAKDLQAVNEPLEGNFEGIGVEFNIVGDTIVVVTPISGGPSQQLGIQAGDRIVQVNGKKVAGIHIKNEDVTRLLKGKKGTQVSVSVFRRGVPKLIEYTITRNTIPIYSVEASYKLNAQTGYIKISRFAATTYNEFTAALQEFKKKGITKLVIDLRGNPGGYLEEVSKMVDEVLEDGKLVVYTQGRSTSRSEYKTKHAGLFEKGDLVVLIDETSASASEIFAGAVQDWDRGVIVGRRSFGKGLVQQPFQLSDGSALRLTVSRYYTPSGRCIQKPYEANTDAYEHEIFERFSNGELTVEDSSKEAKGEVFKTHNGRVVYGGGGIKPDVFVPFDTTMRSAFLTEVLSIGLLSKFAFSYHDEHTKELAGYATVEEFDKTFDSQHHLMAELLDFIKANNITYTQDEVKTSGLWMYTLTRALIARQLWKDNGYFYIINQSDKAIASAIRVLQNTGYYLK